MSARRLSAAGRPRPGFEQHLALAAPLNLGHQEKLRQVLGDGELDFRRRLPRRFQLGLEHAANLGGFGGAQRRSILDAQGHRLVPNRGRYGARQIARRAPHVGGDEGGQQYENQETQTIMIARSCRGARFSGASACRRDI